MNRKLWDLYAPIYKSAMIKNGLPVNYSTGARRLYSVLSIMENDEVMMIAAVKEAK